MSRDSWANGRSLTNRRWALENSEATGTIFDMLVANRQIGDLQTFLAPNFETDLHDPFLMPDMAKAVELIREARQHNRKVMIMGDYDADGITGAALLYEMFRALGVAQVMCRLPHRVHDGYGFQPPIIAEAVRDQIDLIVTVDNGVSSHEAIALAKQHGMQVIVCDHHSIHETLPPADAILHPKLSDYPFRELTGVGVAFKLAQAACPQLMPSAQEAIKFLKWSLDLVAIGTVADCATVMGENRVLIKYGLIVIAKTRRPGLQAILKQCLGQKPTYDADLIGFRIAPRINAAGRLSHPYISLKLLTTNDTLEAEQLAGELQTLNAKRQERTLEAVNQAKEHLQAEVLHEKILIAKHKLWHPGIVGLIAGKLTEEYHRPSIIFHETEKGELVASARSIEEFNIVQAIAQQKDLLLRFGGHSQAAGCSLDQANYPEFCERLKALARAALPDEALSPTLQLDCELQPEQMTLDLKHQIDKLEPYGIGNKRPLFLLRDLEVTRTNVVGSNGTHLQLWFKTPQGKPLKGIAFHQGALAAKLRQGEKVQVACHLQENTWNGNTALEIEVVDVQKA